MISRRAWYAAPGRQRRLERPVVSVGNLSMGGRGKTPLVACLARWLLDDGERPAILSRGYGRADVAPGVVVVSDGRRLLADLDRSGDEPLMLAREVPGAAVLVSESRALAGVLAERVLGATVHLLDDGFQHLALARDLDLVLVTPDDLTGRAVPFGRLREPVAALAAADAVIVDGPLGPRPAPLDRARDMFTLRRAPGAPVPLEPDAPGLPAGAPVLALAGIARPDRFASVLTAAGWSVARTMTFPDHHRYARTDLEAIAGAVRAAGAAGVVTTAKDAVRLLPLRPLPFPVAAVPLDVTVEPEDRFRAWLRARLSERRACA